MRAPAGKIPVIKVRAKRVWRCVPSTFIETALESGPSFTKDRRYSIQGEFGAVYLSGSKELSQLESEERGGEDTEPMSCLVYELTLDKLVDLTARKTRDHLGVQLEDLVKPRTTADRYKVTQAVARRVYADHLHGIIAPSVHDPSQQRTDWVNVVLYPAHLLRATSAILLPLTCVRRTASSLNSRLNRRLSRFCIEHLQGHFSVPFLVSIKPGQVHSLLSYFSPSHL